MDILIYGYGTMAGAMVDGWLRAGMDPARITAYNPRPKNVPQDITFTTEIPDRSFDAVVLGFKPHMLGDIAPGMAGVVRGGIVLSILAGVELETLAEELPDARGWVRFMPNLAVALGKSPNALVERGLGESDRAAVTALAEDLGSAEWLPDESQFELVTALAGSGPGFVYRFIDALASAASELGLEEAQAQRLAVQMVDGAGALASASEHSPRELASRVASPGGMTQKGLDVLDDGGALEKLMTNCLAAARDRGIEMGREARKTAGKDS
ncbi:NAD(P)-binding domain-containing protein [Qipengyuania xiapuensis]|uniref:Pyrroline-5-carboxylate reductase n=1 Tax=Qipengyuania xiapuensis TaxID=2867236 RepID=A0ABX8ZVN7_9SPHN|nr:pyrroline-5-carboxylate reductase dimerization domain-containing protein [Qipengyuania xiapuensis]QZD92194.1 NAD(P)-binding domain-containing protein [Qipengyuania xiapuensis]